MNTQVICSLPFSTRLTGKLAVPRQVNMKQAASCEAFLCGLELLFTVL